MKRREFITLLGGAAVTWPMAAHGQQAGLPVIGFLYGNSPGAAADDLAAFRQGLNDTGYLEHRNVGIEYRWAEGQYARLPTLAADLVRRQVTVIYASGGTAAVLAAKAATTTIPIVFRTAGDPVQLGLVASLNRPGGNVTGATIIAAQLASKQLELLHELVPKAVLIGVLVNPSGPNAEPQTKDLEAAASALGLRLHVLNVGSEGDVNTAFATLAAQRADALFVTADAFLNQRLGNPIVALAASHSLPTMYALRGFIASGGLISYTSSVLEGARQAGVYTGRILKGEKPTDLPVTQPTRLELVINLKTAKALGLEISPKLLALADEVIE